LVRYHYLIRDINKSKERDEKRYKRLVKIWDKLSPEFISDLQIFLDADDKGKK
jgi:hypothetical protein